jgi:hypothetical protein
MPDDPQLEPVEEVETELAELCGIINAAHGRLVGVVARVIDQGLWNGVGVISPEHWVAWKCGVSAGRARQLCKVARRAAELPAHRALLEAGAITVDQAAVVARYAPVDKDTEIAAQTVDMTVSQLTRVLSKYQFTVDPEPVPAPPAETRDVTFGADDNGVWRFRAALPLDEGAAVEAAMVAARDRLYHDAEDPDQRQAVSWADAFGLMAERSQTVGAAERPHPDRHRVLLHLDTDTDGTSRLQLHMGNVLPDSLRRYLLCDTTIVPVLNINGIPVSVGRAQHSVPDRTRRLVEHRDGSCRIPGCARRRGLQIHHITHWEDGGRTDTSNLICLCPTHHRMHHRGHLAITGNAEDPDGITFTDQWNRHLDQTGRPSPNTHPRSPPAKRASPPPTTATPAANPSPPATPGTATPFPPDLLCLTM